MGKFLAVLMASMTWAADVSERQLTSSPISKALDNNDNFSPDGQFLVYDTRDTDGVGLGNSTRIMKVSVVSGKEFDVYRPQSVVGAEAAPGVAAVSWSPIADEVLFIHGPLLSETARLGFYSQTNRRGAVVRGDGSGGVRFLDCRDVGSAVTPAGAHRGGTHRHEYTEDGRRIGFTYDDQVVRGYGRNIAMLVPHPKAPCGVSHYFAVLLPLVPVGDAKAGDLVRAEHDSWVGTKGLMRAFVGTSKGDGGKLSVSLFVVDIPEKIDITTADSGGGTRYPRPPKGVTVRRLTGPVEQGVVRGSHDGSRVGYYANDSKGVRQIFVVDAQGGKPMQATTLAGGAASGLRWHPSGNSIAVISDNGVAVTCVKPGNLFGKTIWLTRHGGDALPADGLVWSRDGKMLAWNRRVPAVDAGGKPVKDAAGKDFRQIFLVEFPDKNGNGIADAMEQSQ